MSDCIHKISPDAYDAVEYIGFNSSSLGKYLIQFGHSHKKYIPSNIRTLPKEKLIVFLNAYILGDGSRRNREVTFHGIDYTDDSVTISTSSKRMMEHLIEVIIKCGFSCSIRKSRRLISHFRNGDYLCSSCYIISVLKSEYRILPNPEIIKYNDMVYCLELEKNHVMLTKRNGKIIWCGNCRCGVIAV
jgi:UDP-glucuronate decarboxylase